MPQTIEERVAYLEGTVQTNSRNVEDLRELMLQLNRRVDRLGEKVDRFREELADRISALEQSTSQRIHAVEARIDALDQKMSRQFMWMVGIQVVILLAVVGALLGGG